MAFRAIKGPAPRSTCVYQISWVLLSKCFPATRKTPSPTLASQMCRQLMEAIARKIGKGDGAPGKTPLQGPKTEQAPGDSQADGSSLEACQHRAGRVRSSKKHKAFPALYQSPWRAHTGTQDGMQQLGLLSDLAQHSFLAHACLILLLAKRTSLPVSFSWFSELKQEQRIEVYKRQNSPTSVHTSIFKYSGQGICLRRQQNDFSKAFLCSIPNALSPSSQNRPGNMITSKYMSKSYVLDLWLSSLDYFLFYE